MKLLKNWINWLLLNGAYASALWAIFYGPWQGNGPMLTFFKWLTVGWALIVFCLVPVLLLAAYFAAAAPDKKSKIPEPGDLVPMIFNGLYDLAVAGCWAYQGHVFIALIWASHIPAQSMLRSICETIRDIETGKVPPRKK